jgi:hypothetical protein
MKMQAGSVRTGAKRLNDLEQYEAIISSRFAPVLPPPDSHSQGESEIHHLLCQISNPTWGFTPFNLFLVVARHVDVLVETHSEFSE